MRSLHVILLTALCVSTVSGQQMTDESLRVTLIGTGAPPPDRARMGPSTLVEAGGHRLLFDVGRAASSSVRALGLNVGAIHIVFLTHLHVDHVSGLPDLWLTGHHRDRFGQRTEPVVVHGPVGTAHMVEGLKQTYSDIAQGWGLPDSALRMAAVEFEGPGVVFDDDGVRVTAFRVPHGDDAYGYKVEYRGRTVVISGDTGFSEEVIRQAEGADVLIHEVFYVGPNDGMAPDLRARLSVIHTEPEAAARVFAAARPKVAVATHLGGLRTEDTPEVEAEVRAGYSGRFVIGEDLMSFVITDSVQVIRR